MQYNLSDSFKYFTSMIWLKSPPISWMNFPSISKVDKLTYQHPVLIKVYPFFLFIFFTPGGDDKIYLIKKFSNARWGYCAEV